MRTFAALLVVIAAASLTPAGSTAAAEPVTTLVSASLAGAPGNGTSTVADISGDGSIVSFSSTSTDLVVSTAAALPDQAVFRAYLRDVRTGTTTLVSRDIDGAPVVGTAGPISADGRFVAFSAVEDDVLHNGAPRETFGSPIRDAFVLDRLTGAIDRVSTPSGGGDFGGSSSVRGISDDGRIVAFNANPAPQSRDNCCALGAFVIDRQTRAVREVASLSGFRTTCPPASILGLSGDGQRLTVGFCGAAVIDLARGTSTPVPHAHPTNSTVADDGRHVGTGELIVDMATGDGRRGDLPPANQRPDSGALGVPGTVIDLSGDGTRAAILDGSSRLAWRDVNAFRQVAIPSERSGGDAVISRDGLWVAWSNTENDAGTDREVRLWGPATITSPAPATTESYVRWVYAHLLDRHAGESEVGYWAGQLRAGLSPARFAIAVQRSREGLELWVDLAYGTALVRRADGDGRAYWRDQLSRGMRTTDMEINLLLLDRPAAQYSSGDIVRFGYETFLGRLADDAGLQYWTSRMDSGLPRRVALAQLAGSQESRAHRVFGLYLDVLRRTPDDGGLAYWTARLAFVDDLVLRAELAGSGELVGRPAG